jgi:DNA-binding transcriptional LysR family regulator
MNRLKQVLLGYSSQDSQGVVRVMSDRCSVFARRIIHETTQGEVGQLFGSYHSGRKHDLDIAGSEMGLTPSAVRKQIELVEDVLGVPLFIGRNGHLTLTEEGEVFHAEAPKLLEHANLAEEKTIARLALKNHRLLVGHSTHLPPKLIALINRVRIEDAHAVHIQHISGLTSAMVRRVLEGSLHAGIGLLPIFNPDLLIRTISEEPLVVCIPSSHKLASKAVIYPRDLDGEPMIAASREPWPERHREVEDHFSDFGIGLEVVADAYSAPEALTYVEQKVGFYLLAGVSRLLAPAWGSLNRRRQT